MKRIPKKPLLPQNKATVAVSEEAKATISALNKIGIDVFTVKKNPKLEKNISSHADCNLLQLDERTFVCDESILSDLIEYFNQNNIVNYLTIGEREKEKKDIKIISEKITSPYPGEVGINVKRLDNCFVCNTKYVSKTVQIYAAANNLNLYHCNQGYVGCSTVLINNKALMTDDPSVCDCFNRIGFDCLMLSKGQIKLSGHNYGFIGGCCGYIDKNLLAFNGMLESHSDAEKIKSFLDKYNVNYIELIDDILTDIGGIVPILEEIDG